MLKMMGEEMMKMMAATMMIKITMNGYGYDSDF